MTAARAPHAYGLLLIHSSARQGVGSRELERWTARFDHPVRVLLVSLHLLKFGDELSNMRSRDRAECVLHLRCILINGQWLAFENYIASLGEHFTLAFLSTIATLRRKYLPRYGLLAALAIPSRLFVIADYGLCMIPTVALASPRLEQERSIYPEGLKSQTDL